MQSIRSFFAVLASIILGIACGVGTFLLVFFVPIVFYRTDEIMLLAGYFTGIPAVVLGLLVALLVGVKVTRFLKLDLSSSQTTNNTKLVTIYLIVVAGAFAVYVLSNGFYPKNLDIGWDEDVLLNDGSIVNIHRRQTYERTGMRIKKYSNVILKQNELTFNAGAPNGIVTLHTKFEIQYLNQINGVWYLVLGMNPSLESPNDTPENWGSDYNQTGQRLAILINKNFVPAAWEKAPDFLLHTNLLYGNISLEKFAGKSTFHVTLDAKESLGPKITGPDQFIIARPIRFKKAAKETQ